MFSRILPTLVVSIAAFSSQTMADEFTYSAATYNLDSMATHPYMHTPAIGHASQMPGSPKHFVPGYGYIPPGAVRPDIRYHRLSPYLNDFSFGQRRIPGHLQQLSRFPASNSTFPGPFLQPGFQYNRLQTDIPSLYTPTF